MKYMGNFFSLPNEIFLLGLSPGELAVYCYLRRCENQKTHQCWPRCKTIGEAVGMCANTVSRFVKKLEERGLIAVEPTENRRFQNMVIGKEKFVLWITPEAKKEVEAHYRQDNCKSQSEYIEKAVRFCFGCLDTQHADATCPVSSLM